MAGRFFLKTKGTAPGTIIYEGDTPPADTEINTYIINPDKIEKIIDEKLEYSFSKNIVWVRITGLSNVDKIVKYLENLKINSLTLEDIFETYHSPKFDDTFDYNFIIMRSLSINNGKTLDNQISFIHLNNILITFEEFKCDEFNIVMQRIIKNHSNFYKRGSEYLLYALIDAMIDNYLSLLNEINIAVDSLEDSMIADVTVPADTSTLFNIKRKINFLSRHTRLAYDVVNQLLKIAVENDEDDKVSIVPYYEDLFEHTIYLNDAIQYCRDSIRSVYDENMSRMQMKSNKFINILTMLSTLMLPPMVISGIFGMNFEYIPGTSFPYGFILSISAMFGVSFILAWFFKKKKFF